MNNILNYLEQIFVDVNNVMIFSVVISLVTTIIFMKKCYKGSSDHKKEASSLRVGKDTHCCCNCRCLSASNNKRAIKLEMDGGDNNINDASDLTTAISGVIPPTAINVNCVDMKKEWRSFRNGFEFYEFASGLRNNQDNAYRVANLLTIVGKDTFDIFHSLKLNKSQKSTVTGVLDALEVYFVEGGKPTCDTTEDAYESSTDSENESDEESAGIYSKLKAAKFNKLRATMTEDQLQAEKEIEKQQLAAIFELLKKQQEELQLAGEVTEIDLKEQLSLYR